MEANPSQSGRVRIAAVVFQNYSLLPWLTRAKNIALAVDEVFPDWTPNQRQRSQIAKYIAMESKLHARGARKCSRNSPAA